MDVNKLRADLEASQALATEAEGKITALQADLKAKDDEITRLRADLDVATAKVSDAENALATAKDEQKVAVAKLEGKVEALSEQVAKLQAEAKTATARAADFVRGNAVEPFENLPDASQRGASGKTDLTGLSGRDKAAAAINSQFSKPTE